MEWTISIVRAGGFVGIPLKNKDEMEMISNMCPAGYGRRTVSSTDPRSEQISPYCCWHLTQGF